jgi:hypothetical protein
MQKPLFVALAAFLVLSPTAAFAVSGTMTCAVDPFDKDGATGKQPLTVTFDGKQATLQTPWGTIAYDGVLAVGENDHVALMMGGTKTAQLPDFDGMETCLSKAAPADLHSFAKLLGLVSDCGHGLPMGGEAVSVETLFGFSADASGASMTMSISYTRDSDVANDYLEFRQKAQCKRL